MPRKRKAENNGTVSGQAPRAASKGILKLPLGKCLTAPNSRFYADLKAAALSLARARNAMARYWQRFHEDNTFHDGAARDAYYESWRGGDKRETTDGLLERWAKWLAQGGFAPPVVCYEGRWLTFEGVLYNVGRAFDRTPEGSIPIAHLNGGMLTPCAKDVLKDLLAKTSYRHEGQAKYHWQGVLSGEMQLSDYGRSLSVPVKNNDAILAWDELTSPSYTKAPRGCRHDIDRYRKSQAVLLVPLFSRQAGRKMLFHVVRTNTRYLPDGMKAVLRNVISGLWKWSDSYLHFEEVRPNSRRARKGQKSRWYLHLCYEQPPAECKLDTSREGYLILNPHDKADPFEVGITPKTARLYREGHTPRPWQVGNGAKIKTVLARMDRVREEWNFRHKVRGTGRRSHGRAREYRDYRQSIRGEQNVVRDNQLKTVVEIVRYCERHNLGTLNFAVPNLGTRTNCWFPRNKVPQDWTLFENRLRHECWQRGVRLVTPKDEAKAKRKKEPIGSGS